MRRLVSSSGLRCRVRYVSGIETVSFRISYEEVSGVQKSRFAFERMHRNCGGSNPTGPTIVHNFDQSRALMLMNRLLMSLVEISGLKQWVKERFSKSDPVRVAVESQHDQLTPAELSVLLKAWDLMLAAQ